MPADDPWKAQLEALQSRVTQLEAQPATSMPSGYSLLSIRDGSQEAVVAERQGLGQSDAFELEFGRIYVCARGSGDMSQRASARAVFARLERELRHTIGMRLSRRSGAG